ncbi:MAG: hypothetical protein WDO18_15100 [Acidobacteriota bacterium]
MQTGSLEHRALSARSTRFLRWIPSVMGAFITGTMFWLRQPIAPLIAVIFAAVAWMQLRFCEVTLAGEKLEISSFRGHAIVPLDAIVSIEERRWTKPNGALILHFDQDYGVGLKAEFMPRYLKWNPFEEGPLVTELKQLVKDAQWRKSMEKANLPFDLPSAD